ncbi:MAG: hypothetical protein EB059_10940 [Alphaproteobacteria bacterium]|nr:hypothetical protein [Alphaproteobacteria bacterium]
MMEDAATAEISRSQLWQWLHHGAKTDTGQPITKEWLTSLADEEMVKIKESVGEKAFNTTPYVEARDIMLDLTFNKNFVEFLTLPAYAALKT